MLLGSADGDGRWIDLDSLQSITRDKSPRDPGLYRDLPDETRLERKMELTRNYLDHFKFGGLVNLLRGQIERALTDVYKRQT